MLGIFNEKYVRRNSTNHDRNTRNMIKLPWIPVFFTIQGKKLIPTGCCFKKK